MSRSWVWISTAVAALGLAALVVLLTPRIGQAAEEALRARLAAASSGVRAQIELVDARLSPRGIAHSAELAEALQQAPLAAGASAPPPAPGAGPLPPPAARPDDRALRAAAAMAQPEPDLIAVGNAAGAVVSRRGKPAQSLDDAAAPPQLKALLEGTGRSQAFVLLDKQLYRVGVARMPGGQAAVLVGTLIDDRFASVIHRSFGADVTFVLGGAPVASSLPAGRSRDELMAWHRSPSPGYGRLDLGLPAAAAGVLGEALPIGLPRSAVRGAVFSLDAETHAAVTIPAAPSFAWVAHLQMLGGLAVAAILAVGFVWGLLAGGGGARRAPPSPQPAPSRPPAAKNAEERVKELVEQDEPEVGPIQVHPRRSEASPAGEASHPPPAREAELPAAARREAEADPAEAHAAAAADDPGAQPRETASSFEGLSPPAPESLDPDVPAGGGAPDEGWAAAPVRSPAAARAPAVPADPAWGAELLGGAVGRAARGAGESAEHPPGPAPGSDEGWEMPPPARPPAADADAPEAPTLVQPASRELLDRSRGEPQIDRRASPPPPPPARAAEDDEAHFHDTFEKFVALRQQTGEGEINVPYEKFAARLRKNREELLAKHGARQVRFTVYVKDGKAAIKASAIR